MSLALPLALAGLLLVPGAATPTAAPAAGDDAPVAIVDGVPLSRGAYKEYLLKQFGAGYLDVFVNEAIITRKAKEQGIVVTDADAARWIDEKVEEAASMPDLPPGFDMKELRRQYVPHARMGCLIETLIKRGRTTEGGLRREYEIRYGEKRRARHILIRTSEITDSGVKSASPEEVEKAKKEIDGIYEQLEKGADFEKLAEKLSQDPVSARNGGALPEFNRYDMVPEFAAVAFGLKEGETSKPVKSEFGYHVIQVTKIIPPAKPFDEALKAELKAEAEKRPVDREEYTRFMTEIRQGVKIEKKLGE